MTELNLKNILKAAEQLNRAEEKELENLKYQELYTGEFLKLLINKKNFVRVERRQDPDNEFLKNKRAEREEEISVLKSELENGTSNLEDEDLKREIQKRNFLISESLKDWRYTWLVFRNLKDEQDIVKVLAVAMKSKGRKSLAYRCGIPARINGITRTKQVREEIIPSTESRVPEIVRDFEGQEDDGEGYLDVLDTNRKQLTE